MVGFLRNSIFLKVLWGLLALYFFNVSVDPADLKPEHIPEDLSINDQESIIEIIIEQVLGYEDAIKEYDDLDPKDYNIKSNLKLDLINPELDIFDLKYLAAEAIQHAFPDYSSFLEEGFPKLFAPPPQIDLFLLLG